nr:hypothetical protein [Candidatus Korarchaeota archaeon]NIT54703.1 hypothetical protein [Fodinibius sp.]NIU56142.1 hypothetical protein [Phycisphaerae bacterium]NIY23287.1 hypothetical protein [Fodinibius sp.]
MTKIISGMMILSSRLHMESEEKTKVYKPSRATRLFTVWRKLRRSKLAVTGFGIVLIIAFIALLAPIIAPHGPKWMEAPARLPPTPEYPFGTDAWGRDLFSLVI